jgi:uncharacterized DUF497 family protein
MLTWGVIYEWDPKKAELNRRKHGVSFEEAATVFQDISALTFEDPDHSDEEPRELTVGLSRSGRALFLSHCDRGKQIRIISARKATPKERQQYAEGFL